MKNDPRVSSFHATDCPSREMKECGRSMEKKMGTPSLVPSRSRVKEEGENKNRVGPKYPALFVGTALRYLDLLSCMKSYSIFRLSPITVAPFLGFLVKVLALTSLSFSSFSRVFLGSRILEARLIRISRRFPKMTAPTYTVELREIWRSDKYGQEFTLSVPPNTE